MAKEPLAGIRITDFTWVAAGPSGTQLLAMLGAEVIKIESRMMPGGYRRMAIQQRESGASPNLVPLFNDVEYPKLSVTLNWAKPRSMELIKGLIAISDVVTENFTPGTMDRRGLGYNSLKSIKPDIIMLSSSAAGSTGPDRNNMGYAPLFAAYGALSYVTGYPDSPPAEMLRPLDMRVGLNSALGVLLALNHRFKTGKGQYIDLSSQEVASIYLGEMLLDYAINGGDGFRHANKDRVMSPHNCYPCWGKDSWVSIAVATDAEWKALVATLGDPRLQDEKFSDAYQRSMHQEELDSIISDWTRRRTPYEITHDLQKAGVAAFPTMTAEQIFSDPHLKERQAFTQIHHSEAGPQTVQGPPWKFSESPLAITRAAPLLGEHNHYIFCQLLGMDEEEMTTLQEEQVVY